MTTKNILKYITACFVCCGMSVAITSCSSDKDPFFSANEDDMPRIINTDLPEGKGGEPAALPSIERTTNFTCEVIVTPAHYTTVTWFIDDEQVGEGTKIDVPVLAGDHLVRVVATTTKGLSTYRLLTLNVRPAADDPELATDGRSRWLTIGTTKTIDCAKVKNNVTKVFIGKTEASNVSYANGQLTFVVPSMEEGEYPVSIEADGMRYGCGVFTVSTEDYVDPGIKETVIWEGATEINWGDSNVFLSAEELANVPVGATVRLVYEMMEGMEYYAMRITNNDWTSDIVPQFDLNGVDSPYEFEYTADGKAIADEKGMLITGFGYKLTKVVIVEGVAPAETTLWEGGVEINWGDANVFLSAEEMANVPVGAIVHLTYELMEGMEYYAMRITNNDWSSDIVPQFDLNGVDSPYEFEYTADGKAIADEKGMLITGFGYKLTKVTYSK